MPNTTIDDCGFTLVETMVALLVLSVGLIGMAALHGRSLATSRTAIFRSQAITLAGDIAERIRLNRGASQAYAGAPADHACDSVAGGARCTPDQMAAHDLFVWHAQLASSLPGGLGRVDVDSSARPTSYLVTTSWNEPTLSTPASLAMQFRVPES